MIANLTGLVAERSASSCVLQVGGVGFRVWMSTRALAALPVEGDEVTVYTHLHVREDELSLFGFESAAEQELFEKLIGVSGIGPKVALSALSTFAPDRLVEAILAEDAATIATVPGVGKKTAQRVIIELKDKLGDARTPLRTMRPSGATAEASEALLAMGFSQAEVSLSLADYSGPEDAQALLRHGLKRLGGGS